MVPGATLLAIISSASAQPACAQLQAAAETAKARALQYRPLS